MVHAFLAHAYCYLLYTIVLYYTCIFIIQPLLIIVFAMSYVFNEVLYVMNNFNNFLLNKLCLYKPGYERCY